jgi:hypothetical protein
LISEFRASRSCDHLRATYYFTESIENKCNFTSYPCPDGPIQWPNENGHKDKQ